MPLTNAGAEYLNERYQDWKATQPVEAVDVSKVRFGTYVRCGCRVKVIKREDDTRVYLTLGVGWMRALTILSDGSVVRETTTSWFIDDRKQRALSSLLKEWSLDHVIVPAS